MYPYSNFIVPYFSIQNPSIPYTHSFHTNIYSSIPVFFFFLSFFLLFFSLLLPLLLPFSSLLSYPFLLFSLRPKMRYLFWSYPYLILSPFYFTFQSKEETSSLLPSSYLSLPQFSSLFHFNIFLLLLFGPPILYYS